MNVRTMQDKGYNKTKLVKVVLITVLYMTALILRSAPSVHAATLLLDRSNKISDTTLGATATHVISFTYTDMTNSIGSVSFEYCSNSPIPAASCVAPTGFDASGVVLSSQSGETGFSIDPSSTANKVILTRAFTVPTVGPSQYDLMNVINPSVSGTYFVRIQTFASNNATGISVQEGGIAVSSDNPINVSAEVPPFLRFCAGVTIVSFDCNTANSFFIDFGEFSTQNTSFATAQMVAVSNAQFGYSITLDGTTLTSGNNVIPAMTVPTASTPGTSQFGINLRENTNPGVGSDPVGPGTANPTASYNGQNLYKFAKGDIVASGPVSQDYRKYTMSYVANIASGQAPGVYATTITLICLANF